MLCTKIVLNVKTKQKQQFVYTTRSAGILSLQFSRTMNNLSSYCGLVDAKIRASDKDLPVTLSSSGHKAWVKVVQPL
jgi:hypothetical protein